MQQKSDKQAGASRSHEQRVAWEILRDSPTVRMLAAMAEERWSVARREALLDDALDDTFPASDPLAIVAPRQAEPSE